MAGNTVSKIAIDFGANTQGLKSGVSEVKTSLGSLSKVGGGFGSSISSATGLAMAGLTAVTAAAVAATASIAGIGAAAMWGIKIASQAEMSAVSFEVMLGSASRAQQLLGELSEFAAKTPFQLGGLQDASKTLLAFGIQGEDVLSTLQMLGDVAGGDAQKLSSLALVFGQIASAGKLTGGDLLQLINVGFNPLQVIAEKTGKSISQLRDDMSKGLITFDMVKQAFEDSTGEGGRFNGMMEKMSGTLSGRWSTLQDNISKVARTFGEALMPAAKIALEGISDLVVKVGAFVEANGPLIEAMAIRFANAFVDILAIIGDVIEKTTEWVTWLVETGRAWGLLDSEVSDFAVKLEAVTDAAEEMNKELIDPAVAKHLDDLMKRGENLAKSLRLPDEIYADTISELKELASVGAITQQTFERAFRKAADDLDKASMRAVEALKPLNVGAVTRHSSAGFSAVTSGANANKQLVQLGQRQLEESRKQTRLQEESNRLYRESQTSVKVVQI